MKRFLVIVLAALLLLSCGIKTATKGEIQGEWEVLVSGNLGHSALYRYVDKEYGVIIYLGDNYRMTSQKIGNK